MPWFKENRFYFFVIFILLLIMALRTPLDTDMWWHLRAGEETWTNRQIYSIDTFSYTRQGQEWLNHSWLSQVLMFLLFRSGGYLALSIWVAVSAVLSMSLIYFQMDGHSLLRGAILILAGAVAGVVWSPRPQLMSLVMFGLTSYILYLYKWEKRNLLVYLIPVFIIWGNLHGGYVLGIILLGSTIFGELLNKIFPGKKSYPPDWGEIRNLVLWSFACLLAVLINPFGIGMWKIPFNTVGITALQDLISEWASPDFHQLFQQPMLWMLFLVIFALGKSKKSIDGTDLVSLIVFSWLAFTARRNFGPFSMISAPIISRHLSSILDNWKASNTENDNNWHKFLSSPEGKIPQNTKNWINMTILGLLLITAGWKAITVTQESFVLEKEKDIFPTQAVEILQKDLAPGRIFNEYNWGGYLIWHLRDYQIFVDGRTDLYGDEIIWEWSDVLNAKPGWEEKLETRGVDYLLIRSDWPLLLVANDNWDEIFSNDTVILLMQIP